MYSNGKKYSLKIRGNLLELNFPCVMGILNITPDSFYKQSRILDVHSAMERCSTMLDEGATIIDLGAASTRPGSLYPGAEEEFNRLAAVFPELRKSFPDTIFSIDTWNAEVANKMLHLGADIINDISAGELDPAIVEVVAQHHVPYIAMHMRGTPENMQQLTQYTDVVAEINTFFVEKIRELRVAGIYDIIVDPGFGFSKTLEQNFALLKNLDLFMLHEVPILVGLSRKSMISNAIGCNSDEALSGTIAANTIALMNGASILRVHDVKAATDAIAVFRKMT